MKQKLSGFLTEWIAFTFMFFFLYDIFWALADIEDLKHTLSTNHFYLAVDFVFCGIFSMTSLLVSRRILNSKYFKQRETRNSKRGFSRGFQYVAGWSIRNFLQHSRSRLHGRLVGNFFSVWHFGKSHGSHSSIHALFRQSNTKKQGKRCSSKKNT